MAKTKRDFVVLTLIVNVGYRRNGESEDSLADYLTQIVSDAMARGSFTGEGPAEVEEIGCEVVKTEKLR